MEDDRDSSLAPACQEISCCWLKIGPVIAEESLSLILVAYGRLWRSATRVLSHEFSNISTDSMIQVHLQPYSTVQEAYQRSEMILRQNLDVCSARQISWQNLHVSVRQSDSQVYFQIFLSTFVMMP